MTCEPGESDGAPRADAVAEPAIVVQEVSTRCVDGSPWRDAALEDYIRRHRDGAVVAVNGPLTMPACVRCSLEVCPGIDACVDPAVVWLRSTGREMVERAIESDRDRIAVIPGGRGRGATAHRRGLSQSRVEPYVHRGCELMLHYQRSSLHRDGMGRGTGPIAARGSHLRRRLARLGFQLNRDLLEVSARVTVTELYGERAARGYRRDADPWRIRAGIVEGLAPLRFARGSRMAREEVLRNDNCFDALISGYTAFLWARDGWTLPSASAGPPVDDGWIWSPGDRRPE